MSRRDYRRGSSIVSWLETLVTHTFNPNALTQAQHPAQDG